MAGDQPMSQTEKKTKWLAAALSSFFPSLNLALPVCPLWLPPSFSSSFPLQRCKDQSMPKTDIICWGRSCPLIEGTEFQSWARQAWSGEWQHQNGGGGAFKGSPSHCNPKETNLTFFLIYLHQCWGCSLHKSE